MCAGPVHYRYVWGLGMAFWDSLWPRREAQFESGNASTNSIVLSRRHATVSLTKQGALTGNLRVNLSWRMRTSDIEGRSRQSGRLRCGP